MADLAHLYGNDLSVGPTGDLAIVTRSEQVKERILRRLLTNMGDYIWALGFGAGLPRFVGNPANAGAIAAVIRAQMALEADVIQSPEPIISVLDTHDGSIFVELRYADAQTNQVQIITTRIG